MEQFGTEELAADFRESLDDALVCGLALANGLDQYGDGKGGRDVRHRMKVNLAILQRIHAELKKRSALETIGLPDFKEFLQLPEIKSGGDDA